MGSTGSMIKGEHAERGKLQFAIEKDVFYQCLRRGRMSVAGVGKTLQISSREVSFTTQVPLQQGERVQLAMDWPAMLNDDCFLKLEICGPVISSLPGTAAVRIVRHEFRTRGAALKVVRT